MTFGDLGSFLDDNYDDLTPESRRGLIRSTLPGLIEQDYGLTKSFRLYQETGLGITYSDYRSIYYEVLGEEADASRIQYVRFGTIPSDNILRPSDYKIDGRYRFVTQFQGLNTKTGQIEYRSMSFDTDSKSTIDEMNEQFTEEAAESDSLIDFRILDSRIIRGYIRRDAF